MNNKKIPVKKFQANAVSYASKKSLIFDILSNMCSRHNTRNTTSLLITGDPGTGKTSLIEMVSKLIGIPYVLIEALHITQEHIINIPFITYNPKTNTSEHLNDKLGKDKSGEYTVVLADSFLHTHLLSTKKTPDEEYLKYVEKFPADLKAVYEGMKEYNTQPETTDDDIPEIIQEVRSFLDVILFLDEFFRQQDPKIKNILRSFLNGQIGNNKMPENVYPIYASNMNDEGIAEQMKNEDFDHIKHDNPSKDEWFGYMVAKYSDEPAVKLKESVVNMFYNVMKEEYLSFNDFEAGVRMSPRRWTQLMLYVNANIPCKNQKDARSLMDNVEINFKNYLTGETTKIVNDVKKALAELIKETSGIELNYAVTADKLKWRDAFEQQIITKMKLGSHHTHVPVIFGPPGIGKTMQIRQIADRLNLDFIPIDVGQFYPDESLEISLKKSDSGLNVEIEFLKPALLLKIENQIKEQIKKRNGKPYSGDHKYLILFDDLSRAIPTVLNPIRKVLLEKKTAAGFSFPEGAIIVASIGPEDGNGTHELSSHMKDVLDISTGAPSWSSTVKYWRDESEKDKSELWAETSDLLISALTEFADVFRVSEKVAAQLGISKEERNFYLDAGNGNVWYISPREYTTIFNNAVVSITNKKMIIRKNRYDGKIDFSENGGIQKQEQFLREWFFKILIRTLYSVQNKHNEPEAHGFNEEVEKWVKEDMNVRLIGTVGAVEDGLVGDAKIDVVLKKFLTEGTDVRTMIASTTLNRYFENGFATNEFATLVKECLDCVLGDETAIFREIYENADRNMVYVSNDLQTIERDDIKVSPLENFIYGLYGIVGLKKLDKKYIEALADIFINATEIISDPNNAVTRVEVDYAVNSQRGAFSGALSVERFVELFRKNGPILERSVIESIYYWFIIKGGLIPFEGASAEEVVSKDFPFLKNKSNYALYVKSLFNELDLQKFSGLFSTLNFKESGSMFHPRIVGFKLYLEGVFNNEALGLE